MNIRLGFAKLTWLIFGITCSGFIDGFDLDTTVANARPAYEVSTLRDTTDGFHSNQTADPSITRTTSLSNATIPSAYVDITTELVSGTYIEDTYTPHDGMSTLEKKKKPAGSTDYVGMVTVPTALIVGCFGNGITLLAMVTKPFNRMSWSVTLASLAIADTIVLIATALNKDFVIILIGTDIRSINNVGCKIFHFIRRIGKIDSSWCVVLVCVERFIAICFPLKSRLICTRNNTIRAVLGLWLVVICYCAVSITPVGMDGPVCKQAINTSGLKKRNQTYVIVASVLLGILPMTILLILTPIICVSLLRHAQQRRNLSVGQDDANKYRKASAMLVSIHVAYIILVLPAIIYKNIKFARRSLITNDPLIKIVDEITRFMEELVNHSINFFLYTAFNPLFRKRLTLLFCPARSHMSSS